MKHLGNRSGVVQFTGEERAVTNSSTVTDGDFVEFASGRVAATDGSGKLYGVVLGGPANDLVSRNYRAMTTTGDSAGTKKVLVALVEDQLYELKVSATLAADAEGSYYNLTGSTGAQTINNATKSSTVGQFLCVKRIATNAAGTEFLKGQFVVSAPQSATTPA